MPGFRVAGKLRAALPLHYTIALLDALAHVLVLLDSGLCFPATGDDAPEIWWRNMILVLSMVLFGIWHRATLLFLLWGCYHGLLLVLHRQFQQVQHKMNWTPPSAIWTSLSWLTTICLVSLGWIFF